MLSTFDCTDLLQRDHNTETTSPYYFVMASQMERNQTARNKGKHCFRSGANVSVRMEQLLCLLALDDLVTNTLGAELQLSHLREDSRPLGFGFSCLLQVSIKSAQQTFTVSTTSFLHAAALRRHAPTDAVRAVTGVPFYTICVM